MVPEEVVKKLVDKYNVNTQVVPMNILKKAMNIEFEHKDIIGHNYDKAFHIAMAHLREYPDYYVRLIKMEAEAEKYWTGKMKPSIYTNDGRAKATQIRNTRSETQTVRPERKNRDSYGVRKGSVRRRTTHIYPDYIPKEDKSGEREKGKPEAKKHVSWGATTSRSIQTEST